MIYAELSGGLGNQMFVYAFARAMGLCCQEPVTLIDRQDWKTGSPAHTALALQALHISSEVQFITDAGFAKQHLPVQNAAKALMIRHEQRVGLMDRDWHPFEARMAPMLNAIGLHFATEGFTPAKRGHAKNFLAWGYFQGADYFKDQAETIRAELLPIENPEHGFTAAAAAMGKYDRTEEQDMLIVERVAELADRYGVKMQQIALAWHWAKGVASPLIGATKAKYFDDAVGAFGVKLTEDDIAYIEEPYLPHRIVGAIDHNPADGVMLIDVKK